MLWRNCVAILFVLILPLLADAAPSDVKAAEKAVREMLASYKAPEPAKLEIIADSAVVKSCPDQVFIAVFYRQYPIARVMPEPLRFSMVFAFNGKQAKLLANAKDLEAYFKGHLARADTEAKKKDAARAWLRLSENLHQDMFYRFALMDDATRVSGDEASAKVIVMQGGNGEINATLTFNKDGSLAKIAEESKIRPGPRPICHATKLLDPDPVIRAIVEQDLLIMGRACKPYLDEQRARASPDLQKAIDRLWQRIVESER